MSAMAEDEPPASLHVHDTAVAHPLRMALVLSYPPAFALSIAHGALSHGVVPAIGLLPLSFSVALSIVTRRYRPSQPAGQTGDDAEEGRRNGQVDQQEHEEEPGHEETAGERLCAAVTHPLTVFALDVALAAALMVVLVFTWIAREGSASLSMLAAYATMPLLVGFFTHLYLASVALVEGLAVRSLVQWTAWRAVPPDCPNCSVRLRPALPELPWLRYLQRRRRPSDYAPLLAGGEEAYRDGDDGVDEVGEGEGAPQPEAVDVRKKDRKGKAATPVQSGESTPWDA